MLEVGGVGFCPSLSKFLTLKHQDKLLFHSKFLRIGARKGAPKGAEKSSHFFTPPDKGFFVSLLPPDEPGLLPQPCADETCQALGQPGARGAGVTRAEGGLASLPPPRGGRRKLSSLPLSLSLQLDGSVCLRGEGEATRNEGGGEVRRRKDSDPQHWAWETT